MNTLGTPPKITALFQGLYADAESCVRVNGKDSSYFTINSGVRQACVAAPDLFNCVIDHLMTRVCERVPGVSFGEYNLSDLEYAKDTAALTEDLPTLVLALDTFAEEAAKLGLKINWDKTELMHVGDGEDPQPLIYDGIEVKFVPKFKYLGSILTKTGDLKPEVDRRRALATSAMQSLSRPLWRHRHISRRTKLRVYNASVLSILLYGAETWAITKSMENRIDGFDSRSLRRIEHIHWSQHVTNEEVRRRTQQPPATSLIAMRRVRWYGHLLRLPPDHPTKALLDFNPAEHGWRRPRGAPRTRWLDVVASDLRRCGVALQDAPILAQDRRGWRGVVSRVGSTRQEVQED